MLGMEYGLNRLRRAGSLYLDRHFVLQFRGSTDEVLKQEARSLLACWRLGVVE